MMNKARKKKMWILWIIGGVLLIVAVGVGVGMNWTSTIGHDYSEMSYTQAFDTLHVQLVEIYPFTELKGIDWDALYTEIAPQVAQAEADQDREAYYMALRRYAYAIPDGHVALGGDDFGLRNQAIGGGYGISVIGLDDGRVIVCVLLENSPAAQAGLVWGAEIIEWDGLPVQDAVAQTDTIWSNMPSATEEGRVLEQYRYLTRAPIGTEIMLTFQNPGDAEIQMVKLIAVDDQLEALTRILPPEKDLSTAVKAPVQTEILPEGYGYIDIQGFMPTLGGLNPEKIVDDALEDFIEAGVRGIIIDVRNNGGGLDNLVPKIVGHFYDTTGFYEYVSVYDSVSGQFKIDPDQTLTIEPREPYFDGPVVVLVNKETASTAEGIPLAIQALPQGQVIGIYGSNGSFAVGEPGDNLYRLPEGLGFNFLDSRSLDQDQVIQVDADMEGVGGISPDTRVPLTFESVYAMYVDGQDIVLEAALEWLDGMN